MISFDHVSKSLDGLPVVEDFGLTVADGEVVVLIGPSGCGKSTLLNMAAGLAEPDEGSVATDGGAVGYVFQENRLLPWRSVRENIELVNPQASDADVSRIIASVGLRGFEDYPPVRLSGGMAKRCALARAFNFPSTTLLMDEPFSGLDYSLRMEMAELLLSMWREQRHAVLFVTHEIDEALMLATRIVVLSDRPSRIVRTFALPGAEGRDPADAALATIRRQIVSLVSGKCSAASAIAWKDTPAQGFACESARLAIGLDCGAFSTKLVALDAAGSTAFSCEVRHNGSPRTSTAAALQKLATALPAALDAPCQATGVHSAKLLGNVKASALIEEMPALVTGMRKLCPQARSLVDIGAQSARYVTSLSEGLPPQFARNQHCASGTGSFFEDQMGRLGLPIERISEVEAYATSCPQISGRCAVFAKSDIVHRQQEGATTPDVLAGLCRAVARNFKATVVRNLPIETPVALAGGTVRNEGLVKALRATFGLDEAELVVPDDAPLALAIGAAVEARGAIGAPSCSELVQVVAAARVDELPRLAALGPWAAPAQSDPHHLPVPHDAPCFVGVDVGSTSTDLAVCGTDGTLLDHWYVRTGGDSSAAVRNVFNQFARAHPHAIVGAVGVTGSGRIKVGRALSADVVENEITAQATAAIRLFPDATSVLEIGGQDSKFIQLENGVPVDFCMNKICAAGTGSFVEEQAARLGLPIDEVGDRAVGAPNPVYVGERCTVFMESAVNDALCAGADVDDVAAGICHAVVANYRAKVVGGRPVGPRPILQGGVAYNRGVVAAFRAAFGQELTVSPCFSVSGAYGAALLAREKAREPGFASGFCGIDTATGAVRQRADATQPARDEPRPHDNASSHGQATLPHEPNPLLAGYDRTIDPRKRTVGIPFVLMIHKFFPMANAFFTELGYNVLLSQPTNERIVKQSQDLAQTEACYPVKLVYGHMAQLAELGVDYLFLPAVYSMRNEHSAAAHCYGCVHLQTAGRAVFESLGLEQQGVKLLNPTFDLERGKRGMAGAMVRMAVQLGHSRPQVMRALAKGKAAMDRAQKARRSSAQSTLDALLPGEKAIVLITRPYGTNDPVLNMGIPHILRERGYRVITQSALPLENVDLSRDYPDMCWPFGEHIIAAARIVAANPRLFAIYLTNHGCGPDSMLSHLVKHELGNKPNLCVETDEHFSPVGLITRIEAFLRCIEAWSPADAQSRTLPAVPAIADRPERAETVLLPRCAATPYIARYLETTGVRCETLPAVDEEILRAGNAAVDAKEYVDFIAYAGLMGIARKIAHDRSSNGAATEAGSDASTILLVPSTEGAEADSQYAHVLARMLPADERLRLWAPKLETLFERAHDPELLFRAIVTSDLVGAARPSARAALERDVLAGGIPHTSDLPDLARLAHATWSDDAPRLGIVGALSCVHLIDGGIGEELESRGYRLLRMPLSESLWFLCGDAAPSPDRQRIAELFARTLRAIDKACQGDSPFSADPASLTRDADALFPRFAGGLGRYRAAKAVQLSRSCDAVLSMAPEYENTEAVLSLARLPLSGPLFRCAVGGMWEADAWSALDSFLHYVKRPNA